MCKLDSSTLVVQQWLSFFHRGALSLVALEELKYLAESGCLCGRVEVHC